jgi:hypothetical protein
MVSKRFTSLHDTNRSRCPRVCQQTRSRAIAFHQTFEQYHARPLWITPATIPDEATDIFGTIPNERTGMYEASKTRPAIGDKKTRNCAPRIRLLCTSLIMCTPSRTAVQLLNLCVATLLYNYHPACRKVKYFFASGVNIMGSKARSTSHTSTMARRATRITVNG